MLVKKKDIRIEQRDNVMGGKNSCFMHWLIELPDFKGAGRVFHKVVVPPMCEIGYHVHSGDSEAYYVMKGSGIYNDNGEKKHVDQGTLMFTPEGCGHGFYNDTDSNVEILAMILFNFDKGKDITGLRFVKKPEEFKRVELHAPFGGKGDFYREDLLTGEELTGGGRVYAIVHLLPGCELGYHEHQGETEAFYILSGKGVFNDDGEKKEVEQGDIMLTGTGHSHGMENPYNEELVYAALIYFDKN
ncbi:MAG: cupin domain-containing protein [Clostridiales bacterium]|nr:cupin domain-containing protein [Clostridiales bacterium]MDO5141049.1 cupin domain-containing protein [Eubacteriales bacterium]